MRKRMAWALAAGLALGVGASAVLADDDPPPQPKAPTSGWVGPFKEWNQPAPPPKPEAKKKADPPPRPKPTIGEQVQAARYREQADLLRRMAVCDKLMEIAVRNNDSELMRKVEQLQERSNNLFTEHSATLASAVQGSTKNTSMAAADRNKLLDKKDTAAALAAKGDKP
jgi:hypothetical protein